MSGRREQGSARMRHAAVPRRAGRSRIVTASLVLALLVGVGLLLYPTISDLWNARVQSRVVATYAEVVQGMDPEQKQELLDRARAYNRALAARAYRWELTDEQLAEYEDQLDVTGDGVMGYVDIPAIDVELPIYHGTSEAVLTVGVGHLEGSSLPVGGTGTHAVISGHRGLPSARLFTDIDQLKEGDRFYLHVLDDTLAYEVDRILTVEPDELDALAIDGGEDYCTLVTCTPYGINTHRLLVRGHRVELDDGELPGGASREDGTFFLVVGLLGAVLAVAGTVSGLVWRRRRGGR